jgi:hypothetical protein
MGGLATHAQNVVASRDTEVFILDLKNVTRIIYGNRQTQTIEILYNIVMQVLWARSSTPSGSTVCHCLKCFCFASEHSSLQRTQGIHLIYIRSSPFVLIDALLLENKQKLDEFLREYRHVRNVQLEMLPEIPQF